jgi:exopolyphosphatase/guanosine-5'-triphosphate,3'-diphosphate pyrophosphatase
MPARIAVVDIGTNSTRLLVANVEAGQVQELERRSTVTRLGEGVDRNGRLGEEPMERVFRTLTAYREAIDALGGAEVAVAVLTSAVRDADNGAEFTATVRERFGLDATTIPGDEEARLTYLGATSDGAADDVGGPLLVFDIGGGSTEFIVGVDGELTFRVSTQAGVVRQSERHLHSDPPPQDEVAELAQEVRGIIEAEVPGEIRSSVSAAIGVAGTATSAASIDLALDPYDPDRVQGHELSLETCEAMLARLAVLPLAERREVTGLHPDRAPTIVAGMAIFIEAMCAFGLGSVTVSEHDILHGVALDRAGS